MTTMEKLEKKITKAMEASSFCRGELCRLLEPKVDNFGYTLSALCASAGNCSSEKVAELKDKIRMTYKNIPADIHIC